jgi:hypothetical protein
MVGQRRGAAHRWWHQVFDDRRHVREASNRQHQVDELDASDAHPLHVVPFEQLGQVLAEQGESSPSLPSTEGDPRLDRPLGVCVPGGSMTETPSSKSRFASSSRPWNDAV